MRLGRVERLALSNHQQSVYERRESILLAIHCVCTVALVACLNASVMAQSRPKTTPTGEGQPQDDKQIGTQRALESVAAELRALREQAAAKEKREAARDSQPGAPIWSNWILIAVTGGAVLAAFRTLGQLKKQVAANTDEASAAKMNAEAILLAERAYVDLSHLPPGLRQDPKHGFLISFAIQNNGKTPAEILGGRVFFTSTDKPGFQWAQLFEVAKLPPGYIAASEKLWVTDQPVNIPQNRLDSAIWMIGEVDYRDCFGRGHRSAYGRRYYPARHDNNLLFDPATAGLNYDRPLTEEEENEYPKTVSSTYRNPHTRALHNQLH